MKNIRLLFSFVLLCSVSLHAQSGINYKQLKYWYECSQGLDKGSKEIGTELLSEDLKDPDFTLSAFSYQEKILQIHDILSTLPVDRFTASGQTQEQIDALVTLMRDLEVHCGEGKHPEVNLASLVDRIAPITKPRTLSLTL